MYVNRADQRQALAGRLGLGPEKADDLSRWALANPDAFDADDLRCWRIGSHSWLALADQQLDTVQRVQRPVGLFVAPAFTARGVAADAGAITRRDPPGRGARRARRARPVHRRRWRRTACRHCSSESTCRPCTPDPRSALTAPGSWHRSSRETRPAREPRDSARQARPVGQAARVAAQLHGRRQRRGHLRAAAAGGYLPGPRLPPAPARRQAPERAAQRASQRGDGSRRGGADGGRARAAAAALNRGSRASEGQHPRRADEGPPRSADDHEL